MQRVLDPVKANECIIGEERGKVKQWAKNDAFCLTGSRLSAIVGSNLK